MTDLSGASAANWRLHHLTLLVKQFVTCTNGAKRSKREFGNELHAVTILIHTEETNKVAGLFVCSSLHKHATLPRGCYFYNGSKASDPPHRRLGWGSTVLSAIDTDTVIPVPLLIGSRTKCFGSMLDRLGGGGGNSLVSVSICGFATDIEASRERHAPLSRLEVRMRLSR